MASAWPALDVGLTTESTAGVEDLFQAALSDYDVVAIDEGPPEGWRVFFSSAAERDSAAVHLSVDFPGLSMRPVDVPDEDWAARSQASLRAIHVGRIIVAPPWDAPVTIVIRPSMGFGTGHHATTRLCLDALQHVEVSGLTVLDVGTGSGVLAIAASLLGAAGVTGIDEDEDAVHASWDNLALNGGAMVSLLIGDFRSTPLAHADIVLANLTGGLLMSAADRLRQLTAPGGRLILSGFRLHEEGDVLATFPGLSVERRGEEEGWICVTLGGRG